MPRPRSPPRAVTEFVKELEHRLDLTLHELDRLVVAPRPAASALHRLHRDLRRLRVGIAVWARLLPKAPRSELEGYDRRLKRLARLVGGVRDRDVTLSLLADRSLPGGPRERARLTQVRRRLGDDARVGRELLRVFLRAERDAGLFEGIRTGLHAHPPRNGSSTSTGTSTGSATKAAKKSEMRTAGLAASRPPGGSTASGSGCGTGVTSPTSRSRSTR